MHASLRVFAVFFGDLFADDAFMCGSSHYSVYAAFVEWDEIYPGAPPARNGASASDGAGCVANLGTNAQLTMTAVASAAHGTGGTYTRNKQKTRHTINDFVVEEQTASTMTTSHYQVRASERVADRATRVRARPRVLITCHIRK